MLDINLSHYNEMLRYEPLMDELRALAVIIIGREQEDLFNIIKYYSRNFAEDIKANGRISEACLNRFKSAMFTITSRLSITPEMISLAHEDQLYKGSGFREMRWNLDNSRILQNRYRMRGSATSSARGYRAVWLGNIWDWG